MYKADMKTTESEGADIKFTSDNVSSSNQQTVDYNDAGTS